MPSRLHLNCWVSEVPEIEPTSFVERQFARASEAEKRADCAESALREILLTIDLTARDRNATKATVVERIADVLLRHDLFDDLRKEVSDDQEAEKEGGA